MKAPRELRATAPIRRTQQERRETTVRKLIDATTASLIELGYSKTSVQEICVRAEVSQGGLFRHFSSRIELLIRTADAVGDGLLELYRQDFEKLRPRSGSELLVALRLLRANTQSHLHQAWFELLMAARCDRQLRDALVPIWERNHSAVHKLAAALLPGAAKQLPDFEVIVDTVITLFHGEATDRFVRIDPRGEKLRMAWLEQQLQLLLEAGSG